MQKPVCFINSGGNLKFLVFMDLHESNVKQIDQLHNLILQLSRNCFEIKKLCLTVLISFLVLLTKFSSDSNGNSHLDFAHFSGTAVILLFFFLLDVQSFYYQEKARLKMESLFSECLSDKDVPTLVLALPVRIKDVAFHNRIRHAFLNLSMIYYYCLLFTDVVLLILYNKGVIQ